MMRVWHQVGEYGTLQNQKGLACVAIGLSLEFSAFIYYLYAPRLRRLASKRDFDTALTASQYRFNPPAGSVE